MTSSSQRYRQNRSNLTHTRERRSLLQRLWRLLWVSVCIRLKKRSLVLPLLATIFLTFVLSRNIQAATIQGASQANAWDLLFAVFASPYGVLYCFTPLQLYLITVLQSEFGFNESLLLRVRSRSGWWFNNLAVVGIFVCVYLVLICSVGYILASFLFPWQSSWSSYAFTDPTRISLPPVALSYTPIYVFGWLVILLLGWWLSLGFIMLLVAQLLDAKWSFGCGMLLNLSAVIVFNTGISAPFNRWFMVYHFMLGTHAFGDPQSPYPSLVQSCVYWSIWLMMTSITGWWVSRRQDFLRKA
jgi:hypothetical protein